MPSIVVGLAPSLSLCVKRSSIFPVILDPLFRVPRPYSYFIIWILLAPWMLFAFAGLLSQLLNLDCLNLFGSHFLI